ncbi:sodium:proton antiporter [Nocardia sp. BMG111209]|uniref:sodium:proton antiporter n=1 Tax=Nocardia sp. BMG111209 TaxID=1160137 RepID=UPI00037FD135|nr:NADH-quinone oxidoreductase subunit K [Nocardia sp. BMG111209]
MTLFPYLVAGWILLAGIYGVVRSRHLVHTVVCVSIAQSSTYVLLLAIGYQRHATAPIFGPANPPDSPVVDPVVQAMTLTDIVVSATVTALLLALVILVAKRHGTVVPDRLHALRG